MHPKDPVRRPAGRPSPSGLGLATQEDDRDSSYVAGDQRKKPPAQTGSTRDYAGFAEAAKAGRVVPGLLVDKAGPLTAAQAQRHRSTG